MTVTEFNARLGSVGRRQFTGSVTMSSGSALVDVPCEKVVSVQVTESGLASADRYGALITTTTNGVTRVVVDSSNASSTATVFVTIVGY